LSLRARLLALVILAVTPAFCLTLYTSFHERDRASDDAQVEALRVANLATKDQHDRVATARQELSVLASLPLIASADAAVCNQFLGSALTGTSIYNSISVIDTNGAVTCSTTPAAVGRDASTSPWFLRLKTTHQFTTGGYTFSALTGAPGLVVAFPIKNGSGEV